VPISDNALALIICYAPIAILVALYLYYFKKAARFLRNNENVKRQLNSAVHEPDSAAESFYFLKIIFLRKLEFFPDDSRPLIIKVRVLMLVNVLIAILAPHWLTAF